MHSAHSRPEDAKTDDITKHQVKSIAPRERDTFLPQPSLSSPDPRSDMHWGLASTKLADDHESESGDVLQGMMVLPRIKKPAPGLAVCQPSHRGFDPMLTSGNLQPHCAAYMQRRHHQRRPGKPQSNTRRQESFPQAPPSSSGRPKRRASTPTKTLKMGNCQSAGRPMTSSATPVPEETVAEILATSAVPGIEMVMLDISRGPKPASLVRPEDASKAESVCTPTTTTIGSAIPLQPMAMSTGKSSARTITDTGDKLDKGHPAQSATKPEFRLLARSMRPYTRASPPNARLSRWPSTTGRGLETVTPGTTLSKRLMATKLRTGKFSSTLSQATLTKFMPPSGPISTPHHTRTLNSGSPQQTDFGFLRNVMPPPQPCCPGPRPAVRCQPECDMRAAPRFGIAKGAAHMAVARSGRHPLMASRNPRLETAQRGHQQGKRGRLDQGTQGKGQEHDQAVYEKDTDSRGHAGDSAVTRGLPVNKKKRESGQGCGVQEGDTALLEVIYDAAALTLHLLTKYWIHVRPVFQRSSALRVRLRGGGLSLEDALLCVLAAGFVVTTAVVGLLVLRVLVAVSWFLRGVSRLMRALSGV